jgi:hypothetical protein
MPLKPDIGRFASTCCACDGRPGYLRQMKTTVRVLGKLPEEEMPADVETELLRRFRGMNSPPGQKGS